MELNRETVKAKNEERIIRELFRQKLEHAELVPDPSVREGLMKRLAFKEFLHFNPARFNIWYLGAGAAAVLAVVLLLSGGPDRSDNEKNNTAPPAGNYDMDVTGGLMNDQAGDLYPVKLKEAGKEMTETCDIMLQGSPDSVGGAERSRVRTDQGEDDIFRTAVAKSIPENILLPAAGRTGKSLQGTTASGGLSFTPSVTEGCIPLRVNFRNNSTLSGPFHWSFGDGGYSHERDPEWIFDNGGDYKVTLTTPRPDGSSEVSSVTISAWPVPSAHFEIIRPDNNRPGGEIRFVNYSSGAVSYKWDFGDGNTSDFFEPRHTYEKQGNYNITLTIYSENGCRASQVIVNAFSGSGYFIQFPNAFIPNTGGPAGGYYSYTSDESAAIFHPVFSGIDEYQLRIFSRMGLLIFESNDINIGWDGYLNGQLCEPGVYIWKVRGSYRNGETFTKMGDLTLLKRE